VGTGIGRIQSRPKGGINQVWPVRGGTRFPVDIKPGSCPNPINVSSPGVLPVAILGTVDLDVTTIDPVTVRLEGVAPIRSALGDVATPFEPFADKEDCSFDCAEGGPDGLLDLALKFRTREIVAALGEVEDGECRVLTLTGNLREEYAGTPIEGEDVVLILNKRQPDARGRIMDVFLGLSRSKPSSSGEQTTAELEQSP
jgi:hypothetical protein